MQMKRLGAVLAIGLIATAAQAQQTRTYGWEDGATVAGYVTGGVSIVDAANVSGPQVGSNGALGTYECTGPQEGSRYLHVAEDPHSGTPIAVIAYVQGLNPGETVQAGFYGWDITNGSSPSLRIWGGYVDSTNNFTRGLPTAEQPGNNEYTTGNPPGWGLSQFTFTYNGSGLDAGLRIEARLYSTPSTSANRTDFWIDNLAITAPSTAKIIFPGELIAGQNQTVLTDTTKTSETITLGAEGAGPFTFAVGALQPVLPTTSLNGCKVFDAASNTEKTNGGALSGNQVRFDIGGSGLYRFTYTAQNAIDISPPATVLVGVQKNGSVIITEIMHRPNNHTTTGGDQYGPWEWLEVKNISGNDVALDSIQTPASLDAAYYNLDGALVPAGEMRIVMSIATAADFVTEYNSVWRPGAPLSLADMAVVRTDIGYPKPPFLNEDTLFLFDWDTNELLDAVTYKAGADGWPAFVNGSSFFLEDGKFSTTDNDNGANWKLSMASANNSYQTTETFGGELDIDVGSPMLEPGGPTQVPSDAYNLYFTIAADGATYPIALSAIPEPASYTILSLPTGEAPTSGIGGTLSDPNGGAIAAAPYTLASGGAVVNFTPTAAGVFRFQYRATDAAGVVSDVANVVLYVQAVDQVIVTEILYNPGNNADNDWEWIEIYNPTAQTIQLGSLTDLYHYPKYIGNLAGSSIGPGQVKLIVPDAANRSRAAFLTEWARPAGYPLPAVTEADIIWVTPDNWSPLGNSGSTFRLYAANGALLDAVEYLTAAPWPTVGGSESIALKPGQLGSIANDAGTSWMRSVDGAYLAYATPNDPAISGNDVDVASPVAVPVGYPTTESKQLMLAKGPATVPIQLIATDPANDPLTYVLGPLTPVSPTVVFGGITLTDPNNGNAAVTGGGVLAGSSGVVNLNLDSTTTGTFVFTFQATDGVNTSNVSTVSLYVQGGGVIVTEIMYDAANTPDNDWEWVEIKNVSGAAVTLGSLQDAALGAAYDNNVSGVVVPAGATLVLAKGDVNGDIVGGRSGADFLTEWAPLNVAQVVWVASWPALGNEGDAVLLYGPNGGLLDVVDFQADGVIWPASADPFGSESIYLTCDNFTATANDLPAAWALSAPGVDNAYATPETAGGFTDTDIGSPALEPMCVQTSVVGRYVFYNQSAFDGNKAAIDPAPIAGAKNDDADAIDPTKSPLMLGGGQATFANWVGYTKGVNGLIYDVKGATRAPVAADFAFNKVGIAGVSAPTAVVPTGFATYAVGDVTRCIITLSGVTKTWLQVNIGTGFGLPAGETHFWGSAVADTGDNAPYTANKAILVSSTDFDGVRTHPTAPNQAAVDNVWDVDKNARVSSTDTDAVINNATNPGNALKAIVK